MIQQGRLLLTFDLMYSDTKHTDKPRMLEHHVTLKKHYKWLWKTWVDDETRNISYEQAKKTRKAKKIIPISHIFEWLSLNDNVVKCKMHNNSSNNNQYGFSDTKHSNKNNARNKAFSSLCKAAHLNAIWLLVEQSLSCCRRKDRDNISVWGSRESCARGYTNMQQAYQFVLISKLQVQDPTARSIMQSNWSSK